MNAPTKPIKPQNKGTKVLSRNPIIERLSRTNSAIPISIFLSLSAFLMVWGFLYSEIAWFDQVAIFFFGLVLFSLIEYLVHRYIFHMVTNTKLREKIQYAFHGVHHEFPKDTTRLAMPPVISVLIVTILYLLFKFIIGDYTYGFLPGFITGYSLYLIVHYVVHAYQPPKNFLKALWINHGIHHYKDHERAFGVSSPLWDYVFRTTPKKSKSHS
jgi:sterol desaturase/sphingolipid hydroxylase (fatty acid hydroxylase superfamily)